MCHLHLWQKLWLSHLFYSPHFYGRHGKGKAFEMVAKRVKMCSRDISRFEVWIIAARVFVSIYFPGLWATKKSDPIVPEKKASNQRKWCLMACSTIIQISDAFSDHSFQRHSRDRAIHSKMITLQALFSEWVSWSECDLMVLSDSCDATIAKTKDDLAASGSFLTKADFFT